MLAKNGLDNGVHFMVMDKQGNTITIKAFNPEGTVMDESVLQK